MYKNKSKIMGAMLVLISLTACNSMRTDNQQSVVVASSQLFHADVRNINVMRGPLVDGLVGQEIDQIMDFGDRQNMIVGIVDGAMNQSTEWINYRRHVHYQVIPVATNWTPQGNYCRDFQVTILMQNGVKRGQGMLCKIGKNTWQPMSQLTS